MSASNSSGDSSGDVHHLLSSSASFGSQSVRQRIPAATGENFDEYRKNAVSKNDKPSNLLGKAAPPSSMVGRFWFWLDEFLPDNHAKALAVICFLSFFTRFYGLSQPPSIVWDETHFGKFASYYIKRTFYFDVHPPLGKMLIYVAGALSGYDGNFAFKNPGVPYEQVHYLGMRSLCAFFGASIPPLAFLSMQFLGLSVAGCSLAACFTLFDIGSLTLSRFILLDPILSFFVQLSVLCMVLFSKQRKAPFSTEWWLWLSATGVSLGLTLSVKWVGLFIILLCGVTALYDLWNLLGDLKLSNYEISRHFFARVLCLICLPLVLYTSTFFFHFMVLNHSGPGDGFMSSAFQTRLIGNELNGIRAPPFVAYGSTVSLKNNRIGGSLLHSHDHLYPEDAGPKQQQITCYAHKDSNNYFQILPHNHELNSSDPIQFVRSGDLVRLRHVNTHRNLHSHREKAPITREHFQVSGYGNAGIGDHNDIWVIQFQDSKTERNLSVLSTQFRLIHKQVGCALHSHNVNLPKWGYEQNEVTCNPDKSSSNPNNLWNIEYHANPKLPPGELYADNSPGFFRSLIELHSVMLDVNNNLKPKPDEITSRPWQWPIDYKGQRFTGWNNTDLRVYLIGNPIIFLGTLSFLILFILMYFWSAVKAQRGYKDAPWVREKKASLHETGLWLLCGWSLHYFPFFLMGRVLYFHHFFPCLLFGNMLMALVCDYILHSIRLVTLNRRIGNYLIIGIHSILVISFLCLAPLSYGMSGEVSNHQWRKWISTWDV
eukprot:Sdes_comp20916_c1_seq1m18270